MKDYIEQHLPELTLAAAILGLVAGYLFYHLTH